LILILFCLGCASKQTPLLDGVNLEGAPLCLGEQAGIPAIVQKFYTSRDLTTEEGKIDYLLERIRTSDLIFVRNKVEYSGPQAAEFLRWKMGRMEKRYHIKINTAQDFVSQVSSGSKMSGQPYSVTLNDGSYHNLQHILQNELAALEACLKQYSVTAAEAVGSNRGIAKDAAVKTNSPVPSAPSR